MYVDVAKAGEAVGCEDKKQYLLGRGFPEEVLVHANDRVVEYVYGQAMQNDTETFTYQNNECMIRLTETTGRSGGGAVIPESDLRFDAAAIIYADSSGKVTACDVDMSYEWLVPPGTASTDAISIGWDQSVLAYSGYMDGYNHVKNIGNSETDIYNIIQTASMGEAGMAGWYAELRSPDISPKLQSRPGGRAYITFLPARPFYAGDDFAPDFNIQYNHIQSDSGRVIAWAAFMLVLPTALIALKRRHTGLRKDDGA